MLQVLNEAATGFADRALEDWELRGSLGDVLLVMAMPTLILASCRIAPKLVTPQAPAFPHRLQDFRLAPPSRSPEEIVDAEFEELGPTGE
jgi:hypothetical protein